MIRVRPYALFVVIGLLLADSVNAPASQVNAENPIQRIFADWRKRRERVPVIRYHLTGTSVWPTGAFDEDPTLLPPGEPVPRPNPEQLTTGTLSRVVLLDFRHNRYRIEFNDEKYANLHRRLYRMRILEAGDGQTVFTRVLENTKPGLAKRHVDMQIEQGDPHIIPYGLFESGYDAIFLGAGIPNCPEAHVRPTMLVPRLDPADFTYQGRGINDGQDCAILRCSKLDFWVDQARDSAVVQVLDSSAQSSALQVQYQKTPLGWLPRRWDWVKNVAGKEVYSEHIEVERIDLDPDLKGEDFRLQAATGMVVDRTDYQLDSKTGQLKSDHAYLRLGPDGQEIYLDSKLESIGSPGIRWGWRFLLVLAVPLFVATFLLMWRAYKRRNADL